MTAHGVAGPLAGLAALVAATASFAVLSGGTPAVTGAVWVANEGASSLSVIDAGSNEVVATLTGIARPHNVQAGDGETIWATSGSGEALLLERHYDLHWRGRVGRHPAHVVQVPGGDVLVSDESGDAVTVLSGRARTRTTIAVGDAPHGLRPSPDGLHVLVANRGSGTVTLIDVARRRSVASIPVGREPVQVAFAPDGRTAYVTLRGEDTVVAVDLARRRVAARARVGRGPVQLAVSRDGRTLVVANQGTVSRPGRTVSLVATAGFREVARIVAGSGPHGVALDPTGRRAYVTNTFAGTVSVLDLERRLEVAEIRTGRAPNGITFSPLEPVDAPRPIDLGAGGGAHRH